MRKISPKGIIDDFTSQLNELKTFYKEGIVGLSKDADKSRLAEYSLLAAAVAWESFISDLFIAYINLDSTQFKEHLKNSLNTHLNDHAKAKTVFEKYGRLNFPTHLTKADVQSLANRSGNNITFSNFSMLEERANTWLAEKHSNKFKNLKGSQKAVVDAVTALRNHLAHRSKRSLDAMNSALAKGALHTTGIKRQDRNFHKVGAWLKAKPIGHNESRVIIIISALDSIGKSC